MVFTELAVRGGEKPSHARKAHRKASAGPLSSEFQGQLDSANSKFCLCCYKDAWRKGLIQSQLVVVAGLSNGPAGHGPWCAEGSRGD